MSLFFSRNGSREKDRYASHGWNNFSCGPKQFSMGLQWSLLGSILTRLTRLIAFRVKRWNSVNEQMRQDRTYTNTGPKQRLQHSNDLGTRRKQKKRKPKDHLEAHGWKKKKRKKESRIGITGRSEIHSSQPRKVEDSLKALCANSHKEDSAVRCHKLTSEKSLPSQKQ